MKTEYRGATIQYLEADNVWQAFPPPAEGETSTTALTPRGVQSLTAAKQAVDKFLDAETKVKAKSARKKAYLMRHETSLVTVTSCADSRDYAGKPEFWVVDEKGRRSKESLTVLKEVSPSNDQLLREMKSLERISREASDRVFKIKGDLMTPFVPAQ